MSYVKQTWATGDVITTEKLNHMADKVLMINSQGALVWGTPSNA